MKKVMCVKNVCVKSPGQSLVEFRLKLYDEMSFTELIEAVKEQIEVEDFESPDKYQAETLAAVMAEVIRLPDDAGVRIEGILRRARDIKEIYVQLGYHHILNVIEKYKEIEYPIKNKKAYFKVQLYNSFFESEI